jgi:hypothetical protein
VKLVLDLDDAAIVRRRIFGKERICPTAPIPYCFGAGEKYQWVLMLTRYEEDQASPSTTAHTGKREISAPNAERGGVITAARGFTLGPNWVCAVQCSALQGKEGYQKFYWTSNALP